MAMILVTGMSGTGKSTVLGHLAQRGHRVVDTDCGSWIEEVPQSDGPGTEPQWREDRIDALLIEHEISGEPLFLAGSVWNQVKFYPRFAAVVLLSAPLEVMLERVTHRTTNDFGKTPEELDRIAHDTAVVEPLLRSAATTEIDTRKPLVDVVDELEALVSGQGMTNAENRVTERGLVARAGQKCGTGYRASAPDDLR